MEIQIITLVLAAVAVALGVIVLSKVNKLTTMLRTPIVKKFSPDMSFKPSSRRSISAQEMTSRGERANKDNRNNSSKERPSKDNNRPERGNSPSARTNNNDRSGRRYNNRTDRNDRPDRNDRTPRVDTAPIQDNAPVSSAPAPFQSQNQPEGRRPLSPRVQAEAPAAPVVNTPIATPVAAETAVNEFVPTKVRYGRRNVVKKVPGVSDEV